MARPNAFCASLWPNSGSVHLTHRAGSRTSRFPTMLILRGSPALSSFRVQKLIQDLTAAGLPVSALGAEFVHVVETSRDLTSTERSVLDRLLTYGPSRDATAVNGIVQVVAPRPGTISPWSSKA